MEPTNGHRNPCPLEDSWVTDEDRERQLALIDAKEVEIEEQILHAGRYCMERLKDTLRFDGAKEHPESVFMGDIPAYDLQELIDETASLETERRIIQNRLRGGRDGSGNGNGELL